MNVEYAERLKKLPPYLFEEIDKAKKKAVDEGRPVIDLGVGDPDQPTPDFIIKKLQEAALIKEVEQENGLITVLLAPGLSAAGINDFAFKHKITLNHLVSKKKSLEKQFLELVKE